MYAIAPWNPGLSNAGTALLCAAREVRAAIDDVEAAATAFARLVDDTDWTSEALRALSARMGDLQRRAEEQLGALRIRAAEIARVTP